MQKYFKYIEHRLFLGLCVSLLSLSCFYIELKIKPNFFLLFFVFCFSNIGYWIIRHFRQHNLTRIYLLLGILVVAFWGVFPEFMLWIVPPALVSFGYLWMRRFAFLKIFLICAVWVWVTLCLPIRSWVGWYWYIERFMFVFVLCLIFDLWDQKTDKKLGLTTFVSELSFEKGRLFIWVSWTLYGVVCFSIHSWQIASCIVGYGAFWLALLSPKRTESYYYLGIESISLFYGLVVWWVLA